MRDAIEAHEVLRDQSLAKADELLAMNEAAKVPGFVLGACLASVAGAYAELSVVFIGVMGSLGALAGSRTVAMLNSRALAGYRAAAYQHRLEIKSAFASLLQIE